MARKPRPPTPEQVEDAADRAEGLKPEPNPIGRPTLYKPTFVAQAEKLCKLGATDIEMAAFFDINVATFYRWKHDHPDFCEALKTAKAEADERVERSLYNRAVGYTFDSEKVFQFQGEVVRAQIKEHVPPDTTAAIFWLKNRRAKDWRDIQRHEHGDAGEFDRLADDQLDAEIREQMAALGMPADESTTSH